MELQSFKCSNCGASLSKKDLYVSNKCPYCETEFVLADNINTVCNLSDYEIVGGVLKGYHGTSTNITIPNTVMKIADYAFSKSYISILVIPDSVKSIGKYSFADCVELECVEIPASVSEIGTRAFCRCKKLDIVIIHSNVDVIEPEVFVGTPYLNRLYERVRTDPEVRAYRKSVAEAQANSIMSSGCYIATCVYGSYDCPQVWTLRRFRDDVLLNSWYGRLFVKCYYAVSPRVIKLFGNTEWFHRIWRKRLDKMVGCLRLKGVKDTPYKDKTL